MPICSGVRSDLQETIWNSSRYISHCLAMVVLFMGGGAVMLILVVLLVRLSLLMRAWPLSSIIVIPTNNTITITTTITIAAALTIVISDSVAVTFTIVIITISMIVTLMHYFTIRLWYSHARLLAFMTISVLMMTIVVTGVYENSNHRHNELQLFCMVRKR